jgi:hypothetical protein
MHEHTGLVVALVGIMDDRRGLSPNSVAGGVDAGDEDKAGGPLALCRRHCAGAWSPRLTIGLCRCDSAS